MKDVIISITGTQKDARGDTDRVELVTDGQYSFEDGRWSFSYHESDITGLQGTKTTFSVSPLGVIMNREGSLNSQMLFQPGKKHYFVYDTPFGSTTMGVDTRMLKSSLNEHGGDLELDYDINLEQSLVGHNQFKIHVKENSNHV